MRKWSFQYLGMFLLLGLVWVLVLAVPVTQPRAQERSADDLQAPSGNDVLFANLQLWDRNKIDAQLIDEVSRDGQVDFWVALTANADLSAAYEMDWRARGWYVYETLVETARLSQADLLSDLDAQGTDYSSFWINNSVYVRGGTALTIQALAARPDVARIRADDAYPVPEPPAQVEGIEGTSDDWGLAWIHAPDVWAMGIDGSDIVVANIDTGVQYDHPQLQATYRGTLDGSDAYNWCDPSNICPGDVPCDNNGHGTHTMGTMTGENNHPVSSPNLIGVAPAATWIACKGCEENDCSSFALLECAEWILAPTGVLSGACGDTSSGDPDRRPHIVNNSWGDTSSDAWYQSSVQAWRAAGIFPAFSAGNQNTCGSVGSPGDYQESFSSANMMEGGTISPWYSSRGPSSFGSSPYCKPNIAAPGTGICSSVPNDTYSCGYQGTSMASPHSAGAVALLWQACPTLVGQMEATFQVLQSAAGSPPADACSGTPGCADAGCNCTYGYGYLDALAAVQTCLTTDMGYLDGYVHEQGTTDPIQGASVTIEPSYGAQATTDPAGYYTMTLLPGTYTVTAAMTGYLPQSVSNTLVVSNLVTSQDFVLEYIGVWTLVTTTQPPPMDFNRFDGVFDPHDNLIYFPGGRTSGLSHDRSIWTYEPLNDLWSDTGCDMNHNAANYTAAYLEDDGTGRGEAIYVVGGYDIDLAGNIDTVQRYYPSEPGCIVEDVTSDPFPGEVSGWVVGAGGVAVVADRLYYFGGWQTSVAPYFSDETWVHDPAAPAGSRWTQIVGATLNPARSYSNVAVQDGLIYAMGGISAYATDPTVTLVPTDVMEVFDPSAPGIGWQPLASLPNPTAEGRGFSVEAADLGLNQPGDRLYVAGGGEWPGSTAATLEYDLAGDDWNPHFSELNSARRDHAGSYVSVCTPNPDDGLPAMWVFGGRVSTTDDEPPYGLPEFYSFPCPAPDPPEAALTAATNRDTSGNGGLLAGCAPLTVQFTDISSGTVLERQWDLGDQTVPLTGWRPRHAFEAGTYTPTLTVSNTSGSDSVSTTVVVSVTPSAAFTYSPVLIYDGDPVQFTDGSAGDVVGWLWQLDDGPTSAEQNPTHTYASPGYYTITLMVTGTNGCPSVTSQQIAVYPANVPPAAPNLLPINNPSGSGNYTVTWNLPMPDSVPSGVLSYTLEEDDNPAFTSPLTRNLGAENHYAVVDQALGVWHYRIRATTDYGTSDWSNIESTEVVLAAPTLLPIANPNDSGNYVVTWNVVSGTTNYILEEDDSPSFASPVVRDTAMENLLSVRDQLPGVWHYRVQAVAANGSSDWSNVESTNVLPAAPVVLPIGSPGDSGNYTVTWSVVPGATNYILEEDDSPAFTSPLARDTGDENHYAVEGQMPGEWHYRVQAVAATGSSDWSNIGSTTVLPAAPTLLPIDNPSGSGNYTVTWNLVAGAASYQLEQDDSPAFTSPLARDTGAETHYSVLGQEPGIWYYRVQATAGGLGSLWSNIEAADVLSGGPDPVLMQRVHLPIIWRDWPSPALIPTSTAASIPTAGPDTPPGTPLPACHLCDPD